MDIDIVNRHVMKIVIATRKQDSIRGIAQRIGVSYGWTYRWVQELNDAGVFIKKGRRLILNEQSPFYKRALNFLNETFRDNIQFHYGILRYFGITYCFTGIDAVFVWTEGGYSISRSKGYYPIFIKVKKSQKNLFDFYMKKMTCSRKVFYKPVFVEEFPVQMKNFIPADPLENAIAFMQKFRYNFEPALEMIQEMYGKNLRAKYKEAVTNV